MTADLSTTAAPRLRAGAPPKIAAWRSLGLFCAAFIALKVVLLLVLAVNTQYLMDEYAMAGDARVLDQMPYLDVWPSKTLGYAALYRVAYSLGEDAVQVMRMARIETWAVALASLAVLFAIARNIGRSRVEALLAVCIALSFSSFMERVFLVRPEPLALLLALGALWMATRWPERLAPCILAGLLSGAAFLTTQKAAYFNLALGLALVGEGLLRGSIRRALGASALLVLGWIAIVAVYVGYFGLQGAEVGRLAQWIFLGPPTDNVIRGHEAYENLRLFVWQTFSRNVPQYLVCVVCWMLAVTTSRGRAPAEHMALIFTGLIAGFVYAVHPAPWPYNFIMAIPFLALWGPLVLQPLHGRPGRVQALVFAVVVLVTGPTLARNVHYLKHDNAVQDETVRTAERLLAPGDRYYDGVNMIVTRSPATDLWLQRSTLLNILTAAERGDFSLIERIFAGQPKVWILSYRTEAIENVLRPYFERSYVRVAPNIMVSGIMLDGRDERVFENHWRGAYRLVDAMGRPSGATLLVDGRRHRGAVTLNVGPNTVQLVDRGEPLYLVPADVTIPIAVPPDTEQRPLFPRAHSF